MPVPGHYAIFTVRARTGPDSDPTFQTRSIVIFVEGAIGGGSGPVLQSEVAEFPAALHVVAAADVSALVDDVIHIDVSPEGE